jgi:phosphomannomutase
MEAHHMPNDALEADLLARATAWLADDPDSATRAELAAVIDAARAASAEAADDLADRFAGMLQFGTAGLRGIVGAGPNRMNRAVVIRAAAGLTAYLQAGARDGTPAPASAPTVVVGFDARHGSAVFARDTAAVVTAAGGRALLLPRPLPTPLLAFAIRHLGADAGVMVTASHNPARDNGYKVYLGDGSQIVPPADIEIAARIDAVESVASVARADSGWTVLGEEVVDAYLDAVVSVVDPATPRELSVVHTSMHGVGGDIVLSAFARAGFPRPVVVEEQAAPDPDFPTVPFPNPEEPGAMDLALALARSVHPDVVIASDPDADRCAVATPDPAAATPADPTGWRMLRGDEVGVLLGAHVLARGVDPKSAHAVLARSIVSSRLLGTMAEAAGVPGVETLTGFKWIGRVPRLRYGYEEAIGYCVDPANVADKDGISAALLVADMVAGLRAKSRTLLDVLDDLARAHGVYATDAFSVRVTDLALIGVVMARLRSNPATEIGGVPVSRIDDLAEGAGPGLPPTDGLRYLLADDTRVIVRPSGTEPKLKVYLEAIVPVAGAAGAGSDPATAAAALAAARAEAARRLARTRAAMEALTGA